MMKRCALFLGLLGLMSVMLEAAGEFNVRDHGAMGDGVALDTAAINRTIAAAAAAGGGTVRFPAGTYLSFSIRLRSHITLLLDQDATLVAATPAPDFGSYDPAEPNEWGDKFRYQDFGHSHWHNSLIWGEDLENISLIGPGLIHGKGLSRHAGDRRRPADADESWVDVTTIGTGNKILALKNCRQVTIRDISLLMGGHFAVLATGVDDLTIENVTVDTNRDGFDIDACRNVRITNCRVNSPNDDAIVLKSSYALGFFRDVEDVTITRCQVTGFDAGTLLDGTLQRTMERAPDRDGPTGRIKLGTESSGGFKRITISDCTFERSRGLALEAVDGGVIEDVTVTNIVMRDIVNSPVFIRLGNRARSPEGTPVGAIRRVNISNLTVTNADARYASIIAGLPEHPVEDVTLSNIRIQYRGGLTLAQVAEQPAEMVNPFFLRGPGLTGPRDPFNPPEQAKAYPEPSMFGLLPAYGLYVRHARNVRVEGVAFSFVEEDDRPPVVLEDVAGIIFERFFAQRANGVALVVAKDVTNFSIKESRDFKDLHRDRIDTDSF